MYQIKLWQVEELYFLLTDPECQDINIEFSCYVSQPFCPPILHSDEPLENDVIVYTSSILGSLASCVIICIILCLIWRRKHQNTGMYSFIIRYLFHYYKCKCKLCHKFISLFIDMSCSMKVVNYLYKSEHEKEFYQIMYFVMDQIVYNLLIVCAGHIF